MSVTVTLGKGEGSEDGDKDGAEFSDCVFVGYDDVSSNVGDKLGLFDWDVIGSAGCRDIGPTLFTVGSMEIDNMDGWCDDNIVRGDGVGEVLFNSIGPLGIPVFSSLLLG